MATTRLKSPRRNVIMNIDNIALQAALVTGVFVVLYLSLVRPQQKRLQEHRRMIESLRPGDRVATAGGLVGTIVGIRDDETVTIELAENMNVVVMRNKIDGLLTQPDIRHGQSGAVTGRPLSA
jgi:preprotein translocase YajC subunit